MSRAVVVFSSSSSVVLSPVVVLVSRLLFTRRSVRSEGAARAGLRVTRARHARRAFMRVVLAAIVEQGRSRAMVVLSSFSPLVLSVPPRAPLPSSTRAPAGRTHTTRRRADARDARRGARGAQGVRRGALLQFAVRAGVFLCFALRACCVVAPFRAPPFHFLARRWGSSRSTRVRCVKPVELGQNAWSWAKTRGVEQNQLELALSS